MKVLMFGWEFPPHISGGLGTASYGLTKGFVPQGDVEIKFCIPKPYGDEDNSFLRIVGMNSVPIVWKDVDSSYVESRVGAIIRPDEYYRYRDHIYGDFSYMNTNDLGCMEFAGGYPDNLHEEINNYSIIAGVVARTEEFDIIHSHDWLTYPAGIHAKPVIDKYHQHPDKVTTLHNAVTPLSDDIMAIEPKKIPNEKVVTFLGRITMQKGPEYFVEAAAQVLKKTKNIRFCMAGSGDMMNDMIKLVAQRGIADRFHFPGFMRGRQVYECLKASDVYIMPSVSEPFGISPLEAMQCDVPTIISKQSGCAEILDKCIKTDYWDINAMADAIYAICNNDSLYEYLKVEGRREVDNITWENVALKLRGLYEKVMAQ